MAATKQLNTYSSVEYTGITPDSKTPCSSSLASITSSCSALPTIKMQRSSPGAVPSPQIFAALERGMMREVPLTRRVDSNWLQWKSTSALETGAIFSLFIACVWCLQKMRYSFCPDLSLGFFRANQTQAWSKVRPVSCFPESSLSCNKRSTFRSVSTGSAMAEMRGEDVEMLTSVPIKTWCERVV